MCGNKCGNRSGFFASWFRNSVSPSASAQYQTTYTVPSGQYVAPQPQRKTCAERKQERREARAARRAAGGGCCGKKRMQMQAVQPVVMVNGGQIQPVVGQNYMEPRGFRDEKYSDGSDVGSDEGFEMVNDVEPPSYKEAVVKA